VNIGEGEYCQKTARVDSLMKALANLDAAPGRKLYKSK
jgi:hypothetical protein